MCLLLDEDTAGTIDSFLTKSMFTQTNNKQRCRDEVMNEFLFNAVVEKKGGQGFADRHTRTHTQTKCNSPRPRMRSEG